jgi:CheY-like chemotaxis protein
MFSRSKHQALVVDDDPSIRETIAILLISSGYDVATAEDGFGALQAAQADDAHLDRL